MKNALTPRPARTSSRLVGRLVAGLVVGVSFAAFTLPGFAHTDKERQRIEVAFVLDTTGSMGSLIKGAKKKIWAIANTIVDVNPDADIHMALIGYRDFGDQYVTKTFRMSRDIQGLYGNLLQFRAAGGGDTREAVNEALNVSISKLKWSQQKNARKIVFLVGDAPPHMDYNGPKYPEILEMADDNDIVVNTVQAGSSRTTRRVWKDIAQRGGGSYIPIPQDGGTVVVIETPYDEEIIILQREIDETVIPYGSRHRQSMFRDKMERKAASAPSVILDNSAFYSKRKYAREVITGGGDLIGDIRNGRTSLDKVKEAEMPKALKGKNAAQRQAYINSRLEARKKLEQKMRTLVTRRDGYVAKKRAETAGTHKKDSFARAVNRVLKMQLQ